MTNEALKELLEDEKALERWTGEGGSPSDPFGILGRIEDELERQREPQRSQTATSTAGHTDLLPECLPIWNYAGRKKDRMNTCPFRTADCTLSTPCPKCREVSIKAAHAYVRFDSQGRRRGLHSVGTRTPYESKRGGYWHREAA